MLSWQLDRAIRQVLLETKASKVDIVAKSMGGLVTRWYIENSNYKNNVRKVITMDTPHHGSDLANYRGTIIGALFPTSVVGKIPIISSIMRKYVGESIADIWAGPSAEQMETHSDFLRKLNYHNEDEVKYDNHTRPDVQYFVIQGVNEELPTLSHKHTIFGIRIFWTSYSGDLVVTAQSADLGFATRVPYFETLFHTKITDQFDAISQAIEFLNDDPPEIQEFPNSTNETYSATQWSDAFEGTINVGEEKIHSIPIDNTSFNISFYLLWENQNLTLTLITPTGSIINSSNYLTYPGASVGYWKLDEGSGTTAFDSSGNNNHGTLINGPTWVNGKYGKALSFDGLDDSVQVPDSNSLDIAEKITISAWIRAVPGTDIMEIVDKGDSDNPAYMGYALRISRDNDQIPPSAGPNERGRANFAIFLTGLPFPNNAPYINSWTRVDDNNWHFVAATYDGTAMRMYVDGVLETIFNVSGTLYTNDYFLSLGQARGGGRSFRGIIDEVKIYKGVLSAEEINYSSSDFFERYFIRYPEAGNWTAKIKGINLSGNENYTLQALFETSLYNGVSTDKERYIPNENMNIISAIFVKNNTSNIDANVTAYIIKPDNTTENVKLYDDGSHSDFNLSDGIYGATFSNASLLGEYQIIAIASGISFTRQSMTVVHVKQLPDLTLNPSDISFSNEAPSEGEIITISANIRNIGEINASNVTVFFYDGLPEEGGTLIGENTIPLIPVNDSSLVSTTWQATPSGNHNIFVTVSPYNTFFDLNYSNDYANRTLFVTPNLVSSCGSLDKTGAIYILDQSVSISGTCFNIAANNVTLDCDGYSIVGNNTGYGVYSNGNTGLTIKNCNIRNFYIGVNLINSNFLVYNNYFDNTINAVEEGTLYLDPDLVGYWKFDEGSGTTAFDSSGNNNNGTLINGPTWIDGKYGKALSFDGLNDYVKINNSPSLQNANATVTLSAWIYTKSSDAGSQMILLKRDHYEDKQWYFRLWYVNGALHLDFVIIDDTGTVRDATGTMPVLANQWNHVATVYDKYAQIVTLYLNGNGEIIPFPYNMKSYSSNVYIGAQVPYSDSFFNGTIDEVKIYSRALSAGEIKQEYEQQKSYWNTVKTEVANIVDGPYIGGNFWNDYTGNDINGDDIGDTNLPYNSKGYISGDYLPLVTPVTTMISPVNNSSYYKTYVPLTFFVNEPTSWIGYSLNKTANVTVSDSTNLTGLANGWNNITIYAKNTFGKTGSSDTVYFFYCLGDVGGDKKVDGKDIAFVSKYFGTLCGSPSYNSTADLNSDCKIDGKDIAVVSKQFGKIC